MGPRETSPVRENDHRLQYAEKAYDEVLDATKHQDDKIGRFLTAIAFLFTGAMAFGARSEVLDIRVGIAPSPVALPGIFLGVFLVLAILSVLLLLVALGPNLNLPSPERDSEERPGKRRSRIYFLSMDRMTADAWWKDQWVDFPPSAESMTRNFVYDAHNLATKTTFKSGRTGEARATFTLSLLFLALSVVLTFESASRLTVTGNSATADASVTQVLPWDGVSRAWVATIIGSFAFIVAYDYLRYSQTPHGNADVLHRIVPYYVSIVAVPALALLFFLPGDSLWQDLAKCASIVVIAFLVGALILGLQSASDEPRPERRNGAITTYVIFGVVAAVGTWILYERNRPGELLIGSLAWIAMLEVPRLSLGFRSWRKRARALRKHPHLSFKYPHTQEEAKGPSGPRTEPES